MSCDNAIAVACAAPFREEELLEEVRSAAPYSGLREETFKAVLAFIDSDFITGETVRIDGGRHLA